MVARLKALLSLPFDGLHQAAAILALSSLASQILALVRDRIFAHLFGTGTTLDVYYAAFKIPDFLFVTIASLVSMTVLIPYFTREHERDPAQARVFLDSVFTVFFWLLCASGVLAFFLIPYLAKFVAPGFGPSETTQFITLSRILLLSPLFLGLSGHIASIVQSFKKFLVYALSPILYNMGIIFGVLVLYPYFGIAGLAWGVILGALLHFAIQLPTVIRTGFAPHLIRKVAWARVREVFVISVPRTITLGTYQLAGLVLTSMASLLAVGSISVYTLSFNLQSVLLSIIGVSYSMAVFPSLSAYFARGERDKFVSEIIVTARHIIFWSLPAAVLLIVLRAQIVRTILGSGNFDWTATRLVAASLALFALSLVAQGLVLLFVRAYYAAGSTKTPLYSNILSGIVIVLLAPVLLHFYRDWELFRHFITTMLRVDDVPGSEVLMLPLAYSLGVFLNLALHWIFFAREWPGFSGAFAHSVRQSLLSALSAGIVAYAMLGVLDNIFDLNTLPGIFAQGLLAGLAGILVGALLLWTLKNHEFLDIVRATRARLGRIKPILPPPEETNTQL